MNKTKPRWTVRIYYKHCDRDQFFIEELEELQEIIEGGPDWALIDRIEINYNH